MREFYELYDEAIRLVQERKRVSYPALKAQLKLDDSQLEALKYEVVFGREDIADEDNKGLVWLGEQTAAQPNPSSTASPPDLQANYTPRHLSEKILRSHAALEGERKQVTVLFVDLVDSTGLAAQLGPETMHTLLHRFFELSLGVVHRFEGTINQFLGDGFMALFGAPIAHEDHARRAVLAASHVKKSLQTHHMDLGGPYGVECVCRIGVNTGDVVVGAIGDNARMDYTAIGDTTNIAARLQHAAEPGEILISRSTQKIVQPYVRLKERPQIFIKGRKKPVTVFELTDSDPFRSPEMSSRRALSQFVGREKDLSVLEKAFGESIQGTGRVVNVVAEAGSGKSRLLYEFRQRIQEHDVTYREGRCFSYGRATPYLPVLQVVRQNSGISYTDSGTSTTEKLKEALHRLDLPVDNCLPYLQRLFGVQCDTPELNVMTAEAIKSRTVAVVNEMALASCKLRPLVIEVEDLHWLDPSSEACLNELIKCSQEHPIFVLCAFRPGYQPPWYNAQHSITLSLQPLTHQQGLAVVRSIASQREVSSDTAQVLLDKAQGNPFFIEELTRAHVEAANLQTPGAIPDTIQGVLLARIDRLPETAKRLLQMASILGREFSRSLLDAIWEEDTIPKSAIEELKRLEFIYERDDGGRPCFIFKHVLTQEVAYGSLLSNRRKVLHARAGAALEILFAGRLADGYDRLAHHYAHTDDAVKAVRYMKCFSEKLLQAYVHDDAIQVLNEALAHVEKLPNIERDKERLIIVLKLAHAFYFSGRLKDTVDLLLENQPRLDALGNAELSGAFYFWLSHTYSYLGDQEAALSYAQRSADAAGDGGDDITVGKAFYVMARRGFWACHYKDGVENGHTAIEKLRQSDEVLWLGQSYWAVGLNNLFLGNFDEALEALEHAHRIGETAGDPRLQTYSDWAAGWVHATRGDWRNGLVFCERSLAGSRDAFNTACATGWIGYAYLEKGDAENAIDYFEDSIRRWRTIGYRPILGWFSAWLADALLLEGELERSQAAAQEAFDIGKEVKNTYTTAWAQRVLGNIALHRHDLEKARELLDLAAEEFEGIHAQFELEKTRRIRSSTLLPAFH